MREINRIRQGVKNTYVNTREGGNYFGSKK